MSRQTLLLGALGAILVTAVWWLFLYSPAREELSVVEGEIAAAEAEGANLRGRLARLEAVRSAAPETEAAIAALRAVVPAEPGLPSAQRQLQAAAEDSGVEIISLVTSRPVVVDEPVQLYSISTSMSLTGSYFQIVDFLRRLEDPTITARGFTFTSLSLAPTEYPALTVALTGQMYAVLDAVPLPDDPAAEAAQPADGDDGEAPADAETEEDAA